MYGVQLSANFFYLARSVLDQSLSSQYALKSKRRLNLTRAPFPRSSSGDP